jgi:TPR repeat protein
MEGVMDFLDAEGKIITDAEELFQCGLRYFNGHNVAHDYKKAVCCYKKAAEQGHVAAQCNLAYCYMGGLGVDTNCEEAIYWYKKAAEQGNEDAIKFLKDVEKKNLTFKNKK